MAIAMPATIEIETRSAREVIDITERAEALVAGATDGSCHSFSGTRRRG